MFKKIAAGPPPLVKKVEDASTKKENKDWRASVKKDNWRDFYKKDKKDKDVVKKTISTNEVKKMQQSLSDFILNVLSGDDINVSRLTESQEQAQKGLRNFLHTQVKFIQNNFLKIPSGSYTGLVDVDGVWDQGTDSALVMVYNSAVSLVNANNTLNLKIPVSDKFLNNFQRLLPNNLFEEKNYLPLKDQNKLAESLNYMILETQKLYFLIRDAIIENENLAKSLSDESKINTGQNKKELTEEDKELLDNTVLVEIMKEPVKIPLSALLNKQSYLDYMRTQGYQGQSALNVFQELKNQIMKLPTQ